MTEPRLFLFDDRHARRWAPFTLTRPAGELLFGCMSLRERAERVFELSCSGHVSRSALVGFDEPGASPGVSLSDVGTEGVRILLLSRAALDFQAIELPSSPARIAVDGESVGWFLPDGEALPDEAALRNPGARATEGALTVDLRGQVIRHPWNLIEHNDARLTDAFVRFWSDNSSPDGVIRIGDHELSLGDGASIEAGVHLDLRNGPIRLEEGASVEGPARLTGPLFVGKHSTILGGTVGTSSIGPSCLVRGEVAHSVLLGFANKAHDGHIGHAIVGRWVNLGAFTTNSDLKNNYRPVRVWTPSGEKDSGLLKVGCFLGDHVKTGIGTTLNTGSVIGAGSNVYGGAMPPSVVRPFSWGAGSDLHDHRLENFLDTASQAMTRRDQKLTPGVIEILRAAWQATARRRAE